MNAGLSNLATLKGFCIAQTLQAKTTYDNTLLAIGLGVAGLVDVFTNRKMAYAVDAQEIVTGDRSHYYVERYPFVSITSVAMRYFRTDNWEDISDQPIQMNEQTGLVHFGFTLGRNPLQVRIIWTGGYWFETKEPTDIGYPTAMPAGATALPQEIRMAWLLQCAEVWNKIDKLGSGISKGPDAMSNIGELKLSPMSKQILQGHIRYQLT